MESLREYLRRCAESLDEKYQFGVPGKPTYILSREQIELYKQLGIIQEKEKKGNDYESL